MQLLPFPRSILYVRSTMYDYVLKKANVSKTRVRYILSVQTYSYAVLFYLRSLKLLEPYERLELSQITKYLYPSKAAAW
jgi:hypothetical protein